VLTGHPSLVSAGGGRAPGVLALSEGQDETSASRRYASALSDNSELHRQSAISEHDDQMGNVLGSTGPARSTGCAMAEDRRRRSTSSRRDPARRLSENSARSTGLQPVSVQTDVPFDRDATQLRASVSRQLF
jgi:hypothetical protein